MKSPRLAGVVAVAALALGGCRLWYKPVPVANAIGEERTVLSGDSVNVYRDAEGRFEIYGPNAEAVYDGYEQLNRGYRAFERHFGAAAPRLAVVLERDSTKPMDDQARRAFRDRGLQLVRYVRPRSFKSPSRYGALGYGGVVWPVAPTAARVMLARYADAKLGGGTRPDSAVLEHFPVWYRAAVYHLIGEAGWPSTDLEHVREKRGRLTPMRELLTFVKVASADSLLDPSRRGDADEMTRLIAAESSTLARYLVEQEGAAILGKMGNGYLAGRSISEMIAEFARAPHSVQELESRWHVWLDTREN